MFLSGNLLHPWQVCGIAAAQEGHAHGTVLGTMELGGGHS